MTEPLADQLMKKNDQAVFLYHRLVLLVTPPGGGKTSALQDVHERTQAPLINVNLELPRLMLDLTEKNRVLQLPSLLSNILDSFTSDVALLDKVELLSTYFSSRIRSPFFKGFRGTVPWLWPSVAP